MKSFGGIDSRAEGPWLGELLAPWAEKDRFRETTSYKSPKENAINDLPEFLAYMRAAYLPCFPPNFNYGLTLLTVPAHVKNKKAPESTWSRRFRGSNIIARSADHPGDSSIGAGLGFDLQLVCCLG